MTLSDAQAPREVVSSGIYLDWNSTTPPLAEVVDAMACVQRETWANPSSVHRVGRSAKSVVEQARERLGAFGGVHPRDVVFTSGGTEANNLALAGYKTLILSPLEHPSVTEVARQLEQEGRAQVHWLPVDATGAVRPEAVERALDTLGGPGSCVALMAANHETGVIQPVKAVAALTKVCGAHLHVDAVQWAAHRPMAELSLADSLSLSAHKVRGPKGVGALLFHGAPPKNLMFGGAQERGIRPGTLDPALIRGFEVAVEQAERSSTTSERLAALRDFLEQELCEWGDRNGSAERLEHVSNLSFRSWPGPELVAALDLEGIFVSSGSACSAGTSEPSKVIEAMLGRPRALSAVRFSLGPDATHAQISRVVSTLKRLLGASR